MSFEDRKRIRCKCGLVQFVSKSRTCVKCHASFDEEAKPKSVAKPLIPVPKGKILDLRFWLAFVFADARRRAGLSQKELASRIGVVRTYVSRVEVMSLEPYSNFERYCRGLNVPPALILRRCEFLMNGN